MMNIVKKTAYLMNTVFFSLHSLGLMANLSTEEKLIALDTIASRLAVGMKIVVHHEPGLPLTLLQAVAALPGMKSVPRVSLSCSRSCSAYARMQVDDRFRQSERASRTLHILLFLNHKPKLFELLCSSWAPKHLVLYSLAQVDSKSVLGDTALVGVEKLVLVTEENGTKISELPSLVVYTIQPFSSRVPKFLGEWSQQRFTTLETILVDRYPTFEGHTFEVASWIGEMPYIYRRDSNERAEGVSVELLSCLASKLNFTYTLIEKPSDSAYGKRINGSWNGIFGLLQRREKAFSINNLYLTDERATSFDASVPCWQDGYGVFLQTPEPLPKWMSVYRTFSPGVWGLIVTFLAVATVFLYTQVRRARVSHGCI